MMTSISQFNAMKSNLKQAGINYTEAENLPTFTPPNTTALDVTQAILSSKKSNPYSDPAVQTVLAEYEASRNPGYQHALHQIREQATLEHINDQVPNLLDQIRTRFNELAADLEEAHTITGNIDDPSRVDLNSATPRTAQGALQANRAITGLQALLTLWATLHQLHNKQTCPDRTRAYLRGNPPYSVLLRYREEQLEYTIWNQVLEGVELSLATPDEARRRYAQAEQEHNKDRRPRVNYLSGSVTTIN
ncbi:hypothetical protein ATK23_1451 [Glutamicibacter mysorens]|uniref:Uncharacterized protein n=1 Tax=Glutamicibacter mysorens TaxID=257984 RepID=A0ABX4MXX3_9MICC|nr:hypothetical protein [Glutamicibacter mysorens]PJJ44223.1 hypothetical protein ATK23_1451 [Glutamicibacter mysorens]